MDLLSYDRASLHRLCAVAVLAAMSTAAVAQAAGDAGHTIVQPGELQWMEGPPSLPPGAQFVVIEGDPAQAQPFTMRLKFPADYAVRPHTHPAIEHVTVMQGELYLGTGESFEQESATEITAGGFAVMPADFPHFIWTDEETVVQLHGVGPWNIAYIDPADDPRRTN